MTARNSFKPIWCALGALTGIFVAMSACSDGSPPGTGGTGTGAAGAGGNAGSGGTGGSSACGNGVVDPQETCDTAIAAGSPGACPASCNDNVACTSDTLENEGKCTARCTNTITTMCQAGDGCCPSTCTPAMDSDCSTTCGDGKLDANEQCDTAIAPGMAGSCPTACNDGLTCTGNLLLNGSSCGAECAYPNIVGCVDADGCCPAGCVADSDCVVLSRIKQSVITDSGQEAWARNGFWDGTGYKNWTSWTGQGLTQLISTLGAGQAYRSVDYVVLPDNRVQHSVLQMDGKKVWTRHGSWDGNAYSSWTPYVELALNPPAGFTEFRSFDQVVFPDTRLKQTLVTWDGKTAYYRYADWDAGTKTYGNWDAWDNQYGDLTNTASYPAGGSFRSFNHVMLANNRIKQALLSEDGHLVWHRYGDWDGTKFGNWMAWTDQWGDVTNLIPGKPIPQAFLSWDEGALAGAGVASGCQNGCDDSDPCTDDACVGSSCVHAPKSCNDNNLCTDDVCENGQCKFVPKNCDDGQGCTVDSCANGICEHTGANCDDGNSCTNDACNGGSCQYNNNSNPCGNGGTCSGGSCQSGSSSSGSSSSGGPCECTFGCKDSCGQPCNSGAECVSNGYCYKGNCECSWEYCGGKCCHVSETCESGLCCESHDWVCSGVECGSWRWNPACPLRNCGTCPAGKTCNQSGKCQ